MVRFRCPDYGTTIVRDLVKGTINFSNDELDDLIIERADGYPTYNFAVVVDDGLAAQFAGTWAGWWRVDGRYVYSMALLEAKEVSSKSTRP